MDEAVTQKHGMACGLACVSFIAKVPYDVLLRSVTAEQLHNKGFYCPELVDLLRQHGLHYGWKKLAESERDRDFSNGDIVYVEKSSSLPNGHFLAKSASGWMDPWINLATEKNLSRAESGFRAELPGRADYLVYPIAS
jgi:hypothetical protein